jgi:hypothetical protein
LRAWHETDAGSDPDDERSLVRWLLCMNKWDVAALSANRPRARDGENRNPPRTFHVILTVSDDGEPAWCRHARVRLTVE